MYYTLIIFLYLHNPFGNQEYHVINITSFAECEARAHAIDDQLKGKVLGAKFMCVKQG